MTELQPQTDGPALLTPRKDRIEQTLARLLARDATRSELREVVYQYADLHRIQGMEPELAVTSLKLIVRRAASARRATALTDDVDTADETMAMMIRWYSRRYNRTGMSTLIAD
ncbi:MAG: hypothetical protein ABI601_02420 [bacterium]